MIKSAIKRTKATAPTEEELAEKRIQLDALLDVQIEESKKRESLRGVLCGIQTQIDMKQGELNALSASYLKAEQSIKTQEKVIHQKAQEALDAQHTFAIMNDKLNKDSERTKDGIRDQIRTLSEEKNNVVDVLAVLTEKRKNKLDEIAGDERKHSDLLTDILSAGKESLRARADLQEIKRLHELFKTETDQINTKQIEKQNLSNEIADLRAEKEEAGQTLAQYLSACENTSNNLNSLSVKILEIENRESDVSLREKFLNERKQELASSVKQLAAMFDNPEAIRTLSKFM